MKDGHPWPFDYLEWRAGFEVAGHLIHRVVVDDVVIGSRTSNLLGLKAETLQDVGYSGLLSLCSRGARHVDT